MSMMICKCVYNLMSISLVGKTDKMAEQASYSWSYMLIEVENGQTCTICNLSMFKTEKCGRT